MMLLTEEEAKTKWCPFVRFVQLHNDLSTAAFNRVSTSEGLETAPSVCRCIASECMAWRGIPWRDTRKRDLYSKKTGQRVASAIGDDADWRLVNPDEPEPPRKGFCGLAGKAE